jgi:hypothetical protein
MKQTIERTTNEGTFVNKVPSKITSLVTKLYNKIAKNKEPDDIIIVELEAMGFKVYPPTRYA